MLVSPLFVEARSQVDLDGRSVVALLVSYGVGVHSDDVIVREIHNNNLRISGFRSRSNISPDIFSSYFSVSGLKVVLEAWLFINVGFPDHSFSFGMGRTIVPVSVVVNSELSCSIFDDSVSIVNT